MDPATIGVAISGAAATAQIFDLIRNMASRAKEDGDTELLNALAEIQFKMIALADENRILKDRIRELEKERSVEAHHGVYWVRNDDGPIDGPFLLGYWDKEGKLVRMKVHNISNVTVSFCPADRSEYRDNIDWNSEIAAVPKSFLRHNNYMGLPSPLLADGWKAGDPLPDDWAIQDCRNKTSDS